MFALLRVTSFFMFSGILKEANGIRNTGNCECGGFSFITNRIIGGVPMNESFPWNAVILTKTQDLHCGASIITDRHILTAGHCIEGYDVDDWKIIVGVTDIRDTDGKDYKIRRWYLHPKFKFEEVVINGTLFTYPIHDAAIGLINGKFQFSFKLFPVCLPFGGDEFSQERLAISSGFGIYNEKRNSSRYLLATTLRILSSNECKAMLPNGTIFQETMMCGYYPGQNTCEGDSGGSLIIEFKHLQYVQIGITSFGEDCVDFNKTGIYTRVNQIMDWIMRKVSPRALCRAADITNFGN